MARIAEQELKRIKSEVAVERLALARGIELARRGADLMGRCPFHDDRTPSLVITPAKNLWHCLGACNAGGGPIDWVMKSEGVSFRHAVELLRGDYRPSVGRIPKQGTVPKLALPFDPGGGDAEVLGQVAAYYHETLKSAPEARAYLAQRGLDSAQLIERFQLGFANRTLGLRLPDSNRKAGAAMRAKLERLGILRESGHEHFNGSITVPLLNESGQAVGMYGRKITPRLRAGTPDHLYLAGGHRGVWNEAALGEEVILCEALLDAMTFWCAGFRNVTASYGVNGFTEDHRAAFIRRGVRRVYLAYDRDEAGDAAAARLAEELIRRGIECLRVLFPRGMDANEYALKVTPAAKSLRVLLQSAQWMGRGAVLNQRSAIGEQPATEAAGSSPDAVFPGDKVAQEEKPVAGGQLPVASEAGEAATTELFSLAAQPPGAKLRETGADEWTWESGGRRWRVRGPARNATAESLKVNLMVSGQAGFHAAGGGFHVDTLDLYAARPRSAFLKQAAEETGVEEAVLKRELGALLRSLEDLQAGQREPRAQPAAPQMSEAARAEALALLRAPDLIGRILGDFERCGVAGERTNKLVGYLAAMSRRLEQPLAVVVQSSSAAGKSSLVEAVLAFVPEEERAQYSAMTGQALYYMGTTDLKHKVLAIAEEEGASRAGYALKLLQSEGSLTIASTGKDTESGKLITHEYRVEGPVAIFLTTTAIDLDEELLNRCLVLTVDEGREQTRAIHRLQRARYTPAGLAARAARREIVALHQNAQRLVEPVAVAIPGVEQLIFPDARPRTRRDHLKYLGLIQALALLHQFQRPRRRLGNLEYIEASPGDIELANRIADEILGRSLDELPPATRRFLEVLEAMVAEGCAREATTQSEYRFTRRQAREASGWGATQAAAHLKRLEDMEYVLAHRGKRGQSFVYELPASNYDANLPASQPRFAASNRPQIGPNRPGAGAAATRMNADSFSSLAAKEENCIYRGRGENHVVAEAGAAT